MKEKILVIDDNADAADILKIAMVAMGHEVEVAYDGTSSLARIRDFIPDVVLCDINMPDMSGYEVCVQMRKDPRLSHTLFVAQTGLGSERDQTLSSEAGFMYHLVKPVDINQLFEVVALDQFSKQQRKAS